MTLAISPLTSSFANLISSLNLRSRMEFSMSEDMTKVMFYYVNITALCVLFTGINVADYIGQGAECTASKPNCHNAIDGISSSPGNNYNWQFFGYPVGNFITITFSQQYTIYTARFMQLYYAEETNFENVDLQFQDGSSQQVWYIKSQKNIFF